MPERTIRLTVAYDGSCFAGWQIQPVHRSVQGCLEAALGDLHGEPVGVVGAGRTDAGVHATGQVASFRTGLDLAGRTFAPALNARLPRDVRVLSSGDAAEGFDARRSARERTYRYYLYTAAIGLPHLRRYCWRMSRSPDCGRLNRLAAVLCGEQDFATFAATGGSATTTVRTVNRASFYPEGRHLVFEIAANAFLRRMVRGIVGSLLVLEGRGAGPESLQDMINARDRAASGPTAPARGLFLESVRYDDL